MRESELYVTCPIDNITCQTSKKALIIVPGAGMGATVAAHYKHHVSIHIKKIHTITLTLKTQVRYEIRNFFLLPWHWSGTPGMLQARGREMARERLIGSWKGTLPVTIKQKQSLLVLVRAFSELQQSAVGEVPLELLLVRKLMQGLKLEIAEALQGEPTWP